jgi:hypothetical protein
MEVRARVRVRVRVRVCRSLRGSPCVHRHAHTATHAAAPPAARTLTHALTRMPPDDASHMPGSHTPTLPHRLTLCDAGTWSGITHNLDVIQDLGMTSVSESERE